MTVRLYLVRHGRAAAGWGEDLDPGLDDVGRSQAEGVATSLADLGPLPIMTSPLRRTRETAAPLAARWHTAPVVEPAFGEIPSPTEDLAGRSAWLGRAMSGTWTELEHPVAGWRAELVRTLGTIMSTSVVFTHFVAINVVVGAAVGDDRLVVFRPANGSCTVVDLDGGPNGKHGEGTATLSVVRRGHEAESEVR